MNINKKNYDEVVVFKAGTNTVYDQETGLRIDFLRSVSEDAEYLHTIGKRIFGVTSGAIALGKKKYADQRGVLLPEGKTIEEKKKFSSIGQLPLFNAYDQFLGEKKLITAMNLVTQYDFQNIEEVQEFVQTLHAGLQDGAIIPLLNEDDSRCSKEIEYGDNDGLARFMVNLLSKNSFNVGRIVLFSEIEGLCDKHPDKGGDILRVVSEIVNVRDGVAQVLTDSNTGYEIEIFQNSSDGRGGMKSKMETIQALTQKGFDVHLVHGNEQNAIRRIVEGEQGLGTHFQAQRKQAA